MKALATPLGRWVLGTAVALVIFTTTLLLVEGAMALAGVQTLWAERDPFRGFSRSMRVFDEQPARGVWITSTRATRYSFNPQSFQRNKPGNGFRFFVLGGSSSYGFPWGADTAFANVLGDALRATWPDRTVEAVNAAAMSYGSLRMRILTQELLDHSPDLLIVYEGHNEFVEMRLSRDLAGRGEGLGLLQTLLHRSRVFSMLTRRAERARAGAPEDAAARPAAELVGLDVTRDQPSGNGPAEKERVRALFEENVRGILDAAASRGVPVLLCTVPANMRDWAPNESLFDSGVSEDNQARARALVAEGQGLLARGDAASAAASLTRALTIAPGHAEIRFRLARAEEGLGRWEEARADYLAARDLDGQPSRVLGIINDTTRRLAAERRALSVDVERLFEQESPHGLVGFNLLEDYVHPTRKGHRLIALELWRTLNKSGLLGSPKDEDAERFWAAVGPAPEGTPAAPSSPEEALRESQRLFNTGVVLENQGQFVQAMEKYRESLALDAHYRAAHFNLGRLEYFAGRTDEAAAEFEAVLADEPDHVRSILGLATVEIRRSRWTRAEELASRAAAIDPTSAVAWNTRGVIAQGQGRTAEAVNHFRRAVELDPKNAAFQKALAEARAKLNP